MNNLNLYDEILYLKLRPWALNNRPSIGSLTFSSDPEPSIPSEFDLIIPHPINEIQCFYQSLIKTEAYRFIKETILKLENCKHDKQFDYQVNHLLYKVLSQKLKNTAELIVDRGIANNEVDFTNNETHNNEAFILGLLKHTLVWLYVEVQEYCQPKDQKQALRMEQVYTKFFGSEPA